MAAKDGCKKHLPRMAIRTKDTFNKQESANTTDSIARSVAGVAVGSEGW